jgi:hypothetical protein
MHLTVSKAIGSVVAPSTAQPTSSESDAALKERLQAAG